MVGTNDKFQGKRLILKIEFLFVNLR